MDLAEHQVKAIVQWAERHPYVDVVWLFGSRAKGTSRPDSDVDIAIAVEAIDPATAFQYLENNWSTMQNELRRLTHLEINVAPVAGEHTPIHSAAVQEHGIVLFRRPNADDPV